MSVPTKLHFVLRIGSTSLFYQVKNHVPNLRTYVGRSRREKFEVPKWFLIAYLVDNRGVASLELRGVGCITHFNLLLDKVF